QRPLPIGSFVAQVWITMRAAQTLSDHDALGYWQRLKDLIAQEVEAHFFGTLKSDVRLHTADRFDLHRPGEVMSYASPFSSQASPDPFNSVSRDTSPSEQNLDEPQTIGRVSLTLFAKRSLSHTDSGG